VIRVAGLNDEAVDYGCTTDVYGSDDVVAVLGSIGVVLEVGRTGYVRVVAVKVAAEDSLVGIWVPVVPRASTGGKTTIDAYTVFEDESGGPVAGRVTAAPVRPIGAFGYPDVGPGLGDSQGILEVFICVCPTGTVIVVRCIGINIDDLCGRACAVNPRE
jgi:hypothetical protein